MVNKKTETKNRKRALKAWETMKKRGYVKKEDKLNKKTSLKKEKKLKTYNRPRKNEVREWVSELIRKYSVGHLPGSDSNYRILTLETEEFLLQKMLKEYQFFVAEKDKKVFLKMNDNKPKNTFLHLGCISELYHLAPDFDVVYLDFCRTFDTEKKIILSLKEKIQKAKLIGFTFCSRKTKKDLKRYEFDLINKIEKLLNSDKNHLTFLNAESYKDKNQSPMITLFFENNQFYDGDGCSKILKSLDKKEEKKRELFQFMEDWKKETKIGIMDTVTKEVIVEGFQDVPTATIESKKLNKLDKIREERKKLEDEMNGNLKPQKRKVKIIEYEDGTFSLDGLGYSLPLQDEEVRDAIDFWLKGLLEKGSIFKK